MYLYTYVSLNQGKQLFHVFIGMQIEPAVLK